LIEGCREVRDAGRRADCGLGELELGRLDVCGSKGVSDNALEDGAVGVDLASHLGVDEAFLPVAEVKVAHYYVVFLQEQDVGYPNPSTESRVYTGGGYA